MLQAQDKTLVWDNLKYHYDTNVTLVDDVYFYLTKSEKKVFNLLLEKAQTKDFVNVDTILYHLFYENIDEEPECSRNLLKVYITYIRRKLLAINAPVYIENGVGLGYRLVPLTDKMKNEAAKARTKAKPYAYVRAERPKKKYYNTMDPAELLKKRRLVIAQINEKLRERKVAWLITYKNGKEVAKHKTIAEAALAAVVNKWEVTKNLRGETSSYKGFSWKRIKDTPRLLEAA